MINTFKIDNIDFQTSTDIKNELIKKSHPKNYKAIFSKFKNNFNS